MLRTKLFTFYECYLVQGSWKGNSVGYSEKYHYSLLNKHDNNVNDGGSSENIDACSDNIYAFAENNDVSSENNYAISENKVACSDIV